MNELMQGLGPLIALLGIITAYGRLKKMQQADQQALLDKCQAYTDKEIGHIKEIYNSEIKNLQQKIDLLRDEIKQYNRQTSELIMKVLDRDANRT